MARRIGPRLPFGKYKRGFTLKGSKTQKIRMRVLKEHRIATREGKK
jgi:hypothetical protein